jgi:hypothetical protein
MWRCHIFFKKNAAVDGRIIFFVGAESGRLNPTTTTTTTKHAYEAQETSTN